MSLTATEQGIALATDIFEGPSHMGGSLRDMRQQSLYLTVGCSAMFYEQMFFCKTIYSFHKTGNKEYKKQIITYF